jgi:hypothetical protein
VVVDDTTVSARHLRLAWDGDRISLEDLGSANGTYVDGLLSSTARIRPGDEVVLGRASLPWSHATMRAFLLAGPRRTTLRHSLPRARAGSPRRFVCGACRARGLLPEGFERGELVCVACGAQLVLGAERGGWRRWGAALVGMFALFAAATTAIAVAIAPVRAQTALGRLERAFGLRSGETPHTATSPEEASIRVRIAPRVASSIDPTSPVTRNLAVRIAATADGPFHVEQVARVWAHVRQQWHYVSDPRGGEYFARASETIENGMAGDCDDFATVVIAMLQSIGGRARMVMVDGDDGGHAYAEVCLETSGPDVASRLASLYRGQGSSHVEVTDVHFRSDTECPVWLNLDWNARVPGGPYGRERWAVAIHPDGATETLVPARGVEPPSVRPRLVRAGAAAPAE